MSNAAKFEITLSFKAVMDGLNQYVSAYQRRMQEVQAFNQRITGGANAMQQMVAQAATVLGGVGIAQALTQMTKGGVEFNAQLEQAQLGIAAVLKQFDQAGRFKTFDDALATSGEAIDLLKAKAVTSPASFSALVQAFQGTVGPMTAAGIALKDQVNLIVNMSQALAGLGIRSEQILQETRALITGNINADAAAAKILGITAADIAKARQQGQLYEFLTGKISAFAEAGERGAQSLATLKSNLGDAVEQRAASATLQLTEALRRLYAELTNFVQAPAFTGFLQLLADKAQLVVASVTRITTALQDINAGPFLAIGDTMANVALGFLAAAAAVALFKGGLAVVMMAIAPLRAAFVLLAGMSFLELNNMLAVMTAGMSRTAAASFILRDGFASLAGAGRLLAISLAAAGAVLAGFMIGRTIIDALERAALERLEAEDKVRQAAADQTRQFTEQLRVIRSIADARATAAAIEAQLAKAVGERDELERRQRQAAEQSRNASRLDPSAQAVGLLLASRTFSDADGQRLEDLNRQIQNLAQRYRLAVDPSFIQGRMEANATADADARRTLTPEEMKARGELQMKRAVFELETQIREAEIDGNLSLQERLIAERDQLLLLNDLGQEAYEIVVNRINLEAEERKKKRLEEARAKQDELDAKRALHDLETAILEAQADGNQQLVTRLTRERDELQLLQELGAEAIELIQARLDVEDELQAKARQRIEQEQTFSRQLGELATERARIEASRFLTTEEKQRRILPLMDQENRLIAERIVLLEQLQNGAGAEERLQMQAQIDELRRRSADNAGAREASRPLSIGEQIAADVTAFADSLGTRAQAAARLFTGPLQAGIGALRNGLQGLLGDTAFWESKLGRIGGPVMGALTSAISDMFAQWIASRAQAAIASMGWSAKEGAADAAAKKPGAILTSISSFGVAAAIGVAAVIAALAAFATGGMVQGPGSGTSDSILARLSNGEFVARAAAVDRFGPTFFESLNNGVLDLGALPDRVARQYAAPGGAAAASPGSGGAAAQAPRIYVLLDRAAFTRAMQEDSQGWFEDMSRTFQRKNS